MDLYDNLVQDMGGLEELLSLRVLMLGKNRLNGWIATGREGGGRERKREGGREGMRLCTLHLNIVLYAPNRIRKITGLHTLMRLDVLDLHGNMVSECVIGNRSNFKFKPDKSCKISSTIPSRKKLHMLAEWSHHSPPSRSERWRTCVTWLI